MSAPTLERRTLDALPGRVGVVDSAGRLVLVNASWQGEELEPSALSGPAFPEGCAYLERLGEVGGTDAARLLAAIGRVRQAGAEEVLDHDHPTENGLGSVRTHVRRLDGQGGSDAVVVVQYDFTNRLAVEERLAASEAKFRQLAETIQQVFFLTDPGKTRVHYISPAYERIWGRTCASLYADPHSFLQAVHPDDRERLRERLPRQAEGTWDEQFRVVQADGTTRWVHSQAYPVRDEEGRVVRVAGIATDITRLKETADALRRSRADFREILERLPVGVAINRPDGLVYANTAAATYLGFERAPDLWGTDVLELVHPDERHEVRDRMRRMADSGEPVEPAEFRLRHRAGHWTSLRVVPVRTIVFEGRPAFLLVVWDLTPQRRAEAASRESEARYRSIFESSAVGIMLADDHGRVLEANPALRRLLHMEEAEPGEVTALDLVHPDDLPVGRELFTEVLEGRRDRYDRELRLKSGRGEDVWVHVHVSGVRGLADGRRGAVVLVEDVRERKDLEEQLRLVQRIESIGRLAGGVAHDFNNLITVIDGHAQMLGEAVAGDPEAEEDLRAVRQAGERAASLTRQLLAFSRRQVLQPRVFDLNEVVDGMRAMFSRLLGEDVRVRIDLAERACTVRADPSQIEQVLLNLAVNARDAMPHGGRLSLETRLVDLDESFVRRHPGAAPGPHALVRVSDTGHGMDEATKAAVFEPFFTTKEPGKGTGLGLSTAYGIVKQSGGYITVESEPDAGARFGVYLPFVGTRPAEAGERPRDRSTGSETILLVEDEDMVRRLAERVLKGRGYRVIPAADGAEALTLLEATGEVDLLLTDVVMPQMSGRELAERVRAQRSAVKVLYMSGYTDDAVLRYGIQGRRSAFLQKPFTPDGLAAKVREVLNEG